MPEMDPMVAKRRELQTKLETILGSKNVYFQPPSNIKLKYPCFIYNRTSPYTLKADDTNYLVRGHYQLTYISSNVEKCMEMMTTLLGSFDHISVERQFISDNLNHDVYNLFY